MTYTDRMSIGTGVDRVELHYFGTGHTGGDTWVYFPSLRILFAGDIFSGKNIPLIDTNNGGHAIEYGRTLQKAHDAFPNTVAVVTGHSTDDVSKRLMWPATLTLADLNEHAAFNREFAADVATAKRTGKTEDEVVKAWRMPAKYAGYAPPRPDRLVNNVRAVFRASE